MTRWSPATRRERYALLRKNKLCVECKKPTQSWACPLCRAKRLTRRVKEKANGPQ